MIDIKHEIQQLEQFWNWVENENPDHNTIIEQLCSDRISLIVRACVAAARNIVGICLSLDRKVGSFTQAKPISFAILNSLETLND